MQCPGLVIKLVVVPNLDLRIRPLEEDSGLVLGTRPLEGPGQLCLRISLVVEECPGLVLVVMLLEGLELICLVARPGLAWGVRSVEDLGLGLWIRLVAVLNLDLKIRHVEEAPGLVLGTRLVENPGLGLELVLKPVEDLG